MNRYIDADELLAKVDKRSKELTRMYSEHDAYVQGYEECALKIEIQPTADVKPIVRGEWNEIGECNGMCIYQCSLCGHKTDDFVVVKKKDRCLIRPPFYCANCGAEMRGEQDE